MEIFFGIGCVVVGFIVIVGIMALFVEPFEGIIELFFGWTDLFRNRDKDVAVRLKLGKDLKLKTVDKTYREMTRRRASQVWSVRWEKEDDRPENVAVTTIVSCQHTGLVSQSFHAQSAQDFEALSLSISPQVRSQIVELWGEDNALKIGPEGVFWHIRGDKVAAGFLRARFRALEALVGELHSPSSDKKLF